MSSKKLVSAVAQERRLKPIYELLDAGNNRKALADIERLLQKTPNNSLGLVLKALALIRLDRDDEARRLLEQVMHLAAVEGIVVGDTTQILLTCYKELRQPQMICGVLEALSSKIQSEDLFVQYFMSLVRVQDYRKMYQTSIKMYKTFHNPAYFSWAIASLFLHHDDFIGPFDYETSLSFQLAERMIDKYLAETEGAQEEEIQNQWRLLDLYLHLMIRHSANWEKILSIFKTKGYPPQELSCWSWNSDHEHYCLAMKQAGFKLELLKHLQNLFMEHKEYALLKQIIDEFGNVEDETTRTLAAEFINGLRKTHPSFVVAMGSLYFTTHDANNRFTDAIRNERIEEDLKMLISFGMDKVNFFPDAIEQFKLVDYDTQCKLLDMMKAHAVKENDIENLHLKALTDPEIIKDINFEFAQRELMGRKFDLQQRIKQANNCFGKYLSLKKAREQHALSLSSKVEEDTTKDVDYTDQYVLIAASILLSEHFKLEKKVKGKGDEKGLADAVESMSVDELNTADKKTGKQFSDGLLYTAICLMEHCLVSSPSNCTLRFMLGNAYARSGATLETLKVIQEISVRHVQWDSLGYLIFPLVLCSGTYSEALMALKQADSMYTSYESDSMEFVIAAYDHCSFKEAQDFFMFRDLLLQSTQFGLALVERRLQELILCSDSIDCVGKNCELVGRELNLGEMMKISCYDNRDLVIMQNLFDDEIDWNAFRETSASIDVNWFKVRLSLLIVIVKMVNTVMNKTEGDLDSVDGKRIAASHLEKGVKIWEEFCKKWRNMKMDESLETPYFGVYPPLYSRYFELSIPDYLMEQVKCVIKLVKEEKIDDTSAAVSLLTALEQVMGQQAAKLVKNVHSKFAAYLIEPKLKFFQEFIQDLTWIAEFFAFSKIILVVIFVATKDAQGQQQKEGSKSKGKKKKTAKEVSNVISSIRGKFQEFAKLLEVVKKFVQSRPLSTWPNSKFKDSDGFHAVNTKYLFEAFPTTYNVVQKNIHESHMNQLFGISGLVDSMIQFISNMI